MPRPKGTKNKKTVELEEIAAKYNLSPFEILMKFANNDWKGLGYESGVVVTPLGGKQERIPPQLRANCASEAAQYLHPKRKAIEHTGKDGGPIKTEDSRTPEQKQEEIDKLNRAINADRDEKAK